MLAWSLSVLVDVPETADPRDPGTLVRARIVVDKVRAGEVVSLARDYLEEDVQLPREYGDLSHHGVANITFTAEDGALIVRFYPDGYLFGPRRDQYLMFISAGDWSWDPGPRHEPVADEWWYVAGLDR